MKNFFLRVGRDLANYWQLYLMIIIVASLILICLDTFGIINLPFLDSLFSTSSNEGSI